MLAKVRTPFKLLFIASMDVNSCNKFGMPFGCLYHNLACIYVSCETVISCLTIHPTGYKAKRNTQRSTYQLYSKKKKTETMSNHKSINSIELNYGRVIQCNTVEQWKQTEPHATARMNFTEAERKRLLHSPALSSGISSRTFHGCRKQE